MFKFNLSKRLFCILILSFEVCKYTYYEQQIIVYFRLILFDSIRNNKTTHNTRNRLYKFEYCRSRFHVKLYEMNFYIHILYLWILPTIITLFNDYSILTFKNHWLTLDTTIHRQN